jgi:hypothetical protein
MTKSRKKYLLFLLFTAVGLIATGTANYFLTFFLADMVGVQLGFNAGGGVEEALMQFILIFPYALGIFVGFIACNGWYFRTNEDKRKRYRNLMIGGMLPAYILSVMWIGNDLNRWSDLEDFTKYNWDMAYLAFALALYAFLLLVIFQFTVCVWANALVNGLGAFPEKE